MKKLVPSCDVVSRNSSPTLRLRRPTGTRTRAAPSSTAPAQAARRGNGTSPEPSSGQSASSGIRTSAFSRVKEKQPSASPAARSQLPRRRSPKRAARNRLRVIQNRPREGFWIRPSK
jgi:hypothetical protein